MTDLQKLYDTAVLESGASSIWQGLGTPEKLRERAAIIFVGNLFASFVNYPYDPNDARTLETTRTIMYRFGISPKTTAEILALDVTSSEFIAFASARDPLKAEKV